MKVFKPLIAVFTLLVSISVIVGLLYPTLGAIITYSSTAYLLLCFGTAAHFLEEWYTKAWGWRLR